MRVAELEAAQDADLKKTTGDVSAAWFRLWLGRSPPGRDHPRPDPPGPSAAAESESWKPRKLTPCGQTRTLQGVGLTRACRFLSAGTP